MTKPLVYVSGPYRHPKGTAYVEENIRKAEEVAKELWQMGFAVICPHANTRHFDGIVTADDFIAGDLVMVERCDLVVMLPGFQHSEGARKEMAHAIRNEVPVFFWPRESHYLWHIGKGTMTPESAVKLGAIAARISMATGLSLKSVERKAA